MNRGGSKVLLTTVIIFAIAFGIRIIHLETIRDNPFFNHPIMDEKYHDNWAQEIAEGKLLERIPFYRAPAYPYFLGFVYAILGQGYYFPRLIGIVIGALSCILIFLVGKEIFSYKVGLLAAVLACFYGMFMYFDAMLLTTYLEVFFCLLGVFWIVKWTKQKTDSRLILAGVFCGLASITRPNFLVFVPVFAIYVFLTVKKGPLKTQLKPILLLSAGMMPAILIVMLVNILVGEDFVILAWNGGINFYLGNNAFANGWSATSPELDATWWGGYRDAITIAERETGKSLLQSQVSSYWFGRGFSYLLSRPLNWVQLMLKKLYLIVNSFELSNNQSIQTFQRFSPLLRIPLLNFGVVLALAVWGFVCSFGQKHTKLILLFLACYTFSIILFFVTARYRMPLVPFLLMFASCAILWIIQQVREGKTKVLAIPAIVIVAMIVFSHTDFYGTNTVGRSNMHMSLGNRYFASGSYSQAADAYKEALTDNPQNADAMNALGNTYMVLGKQNEARRLYEKSLKVNVTVDALCKLAIIHVQSGVMDSAELYLSEAVKMDSTNPEVNYYTGMFYAYNKKPRTAISHLETSLQYYPDPQYRKNIHLNLGKLYLEIGNKEKAKKHLLDAGVKQSEVLKILSM